MQETIPGKPQFENGGLDIRIYLALFWHWAWLILLATLIAAAVAYYSSSHTPPIYQASTTLLVNEAPATKTADYTTIMTSERLTGTYAKMLSNSPLLTQVITQTGLPLTTDALKQMISAEPIQDTQLIQVSVKSTDPATAAIVANTLVVIFANQIQELQSSRFAQSKASLETQLAQLETQINQYAKDAASETDALEQDRLESKVTQYREIYSQLLQTYEQVRLSEAQTNSSVVQVEPASVPSVPISPKIMQNTLLAAIVGFLLAAGGILAREALDDTLKTVEDVSKLGPPVLGVINHYKKSGEDPLITVIQPHSPIAESFRTLRTNVQYASIDRPLRTLLITSADPKEGKTTAVANFAVVLAQSELDTILVDCDFRMPTLHRRFGLHNRAGLSQLFFHPETNLDAVSQATRINHLRVLTTGYLPPNPAELLSSQKMLTILARLSERYQFVVLDTPPILAVTDAAVLAPAVDGVLLVTKPGQTRISSARQAVEQLRLVNARLLGTVINDLDLDHSSYSFRYHYYHRHPNYYHQPEDKKKKTR